MFYSGFGGNLQLNHRGETKRRTEHPQKKTRKKDVFTDGLFCHTKYQEEGGKKIQTYSQRSTLICVSDVI